MLIHAMTFCEHHQHMSKLFPKSRCYFFTEPKVPFTKKLVVRFEPLTVQLQEFVRFLSHCMTQITSRETNNSKNMHFLNLVECGPTSFFYMQPLVRSLIFGGSLESPQWLLDGFLFQNFGRCWGPTNHCFAQK